MRANDVPTPHLMTAHSGPLHHVEKIILQQIVTIETWFREQWLITPPSVTSSVDLRHAGFKLAPVDTNLFPAGFNNLNWDSLPLCVQAIQSVMVDAVPTCLKVLIVPESHTRNQYYMQSLHILQEVFSQAGFLVRIGSLDDAITEPQTLNLDNGKTLLIEPLLRHGNRVGLADFDPCIVLLNNDLSTGVPDILKGLEQPIQPSEKLGWANRFKSNHFNFYSDVVDEFARLLDVDPWLINPYFTAVDGIDFMAQEGIEELAEEANKILAQIADKYFTYGITQPPFVVVKADNGTYGMSVMMIHEGAELIQLNRKQRTRMAASKGSRKVDRVMIQEGVYTFETMPNGAVAEPVVYMIGQFVVGGFYRVHQGRGSNENLNAPGMHFEPLAFASACNMPNKELDVVDCPNRFYAYGVIARLAALAAAREIANVVK
jgi:glutamate--cysteine ligase